MAIVRIFSPTMAHCFSLYSKHDSKVSRHDLQCDQICQIFATLAKVYKSLTNFDGLILIWQNAQPTLAIL